MTLGISQLAAVERMDAWAAKYVWAKLYVGDPGATGASNAAVETTRVEITWEAADDDVAGVVTLTHSDDLEWLSVAASEDPTHIGFFSASSGGDFGGSGLITADPVAVDDDFVLPAGSVIITQPCAA
jgi:hypothetical protein